MQFSPLGRDQLGVALWIGLDCYMETGLLHRCEQGFPKHLQVKSPMPVESRIVLLKLTNKDLQLLGGLRANRV